MINPNVSALYTPSMEQLLTAQMWAGLRSQHLSPSLSVTHSIVTKTELCLCSDLELVSLFKIAQCSRPVPFQCSLSVALDVSVGVAQLSDENVETDDQYHEEEHHHESNGKPTGNKKKKEKKRKEINASSLWLADLKCWETRWEQSLWRGG